MVRNERKLAYTGDLRTELCFTCLRCFVVQSLYLCFHKPAGSDSSRRVPLEPLVPTRLFCKLNDNKKQERNPHLRTIGRNKEKTLPTKRMKLMKGLAISWSHKKQKNYALTRRINNCCCFVFKGFMNQLFCQKAIYTVLPCDFQVHMNIQYKIGNQFYFIFIEEHVKLMH